MKFKEWEPIYAKIVNDFSFSVENDEKAAGILNKLIEKKNLCSIDKLRQLIKDKEVVVFGAGPSLEPLIDKHKGKLSNKIKIVADGATSALLKHNIQPNVITTDLDGLVFDQIKANNNGSIVVVHAHGDNIDTIKKFVEKFKGEIVGTTQSNPDPYNNLYNFGGFTDGDRAVFLADHFHAKKISLIGFDYKTGIGKYSYAENKDKTTKLRKLKWCEYLIKQINDKKQNIQYL